MKKRRKTDLPFSAIGRNLGETLDQKNKLYGSAFAKTEAFLLLLYPNGIPVSHYKHTQLMTRLFDKMMRVANTVREEDIESPWFDAAGYCLLGEKEWRTPQERERRKR